MKQTILRTSFLFSSVFLLASMTVSTNVVIKSKTQKEFNDFFLKRSFIYSSIPELEIKYKTKFNFFQKLKINQAKKKISRQLQNENLLAECDTIKLKNGEEIIAVVNEIGTTEIRYKKCDNLTGPTYSLKKSDIAMIRYANGSKDYFGNEKPAGEKKDDEVNSADAKIDPLAIASILSLTAGIVLAIAVVSSGWAGIGLITAGIILGFVSKNRIKKSKGKLKGEGYAIAGIVGGIVIIAIGLIAALIYISAWW